MLTILIMMEVWLSCEACEFIVGCHNWFRFLMQSGLNFSSRAGFSIAHFFCPLLRVAAKKNFHNAGNNAGVQNLKVHHPKIMPLLILQVAKSLLGAGKEWSKLWICSFTQSLLCCLLGFVCWRVILGFRLGFWNISSGGNKSSSTYRLVFSHGSYNPHSMAKCKQKLQNIVLNCFFWMSMICWSYSLLWESVNHIGRVV